MVKHLNTFSRAKYTPTYSKQGTSSLVRLGFTAYHEADISRRPKIPNASDTSAYMLNLILTLPHNPPFHTEVEIPPLLGVSCETLFARTYQKFRSIGARTVHSDFVWYALFRKNSFDTITHPGPN